MRRWWNWIVLLFILGLTALSFIIVWPSNPDRYLPNFIDWPEGRGIKISLPVIKGGTFGLTTLERRGMSLGLDLRGGAHLLVEVQIAEVVAGLLIGNYGTRFAMSESTRLHLLIFWEIVDGILNSLLFLLIGMEVLALNLMATYLLPAALAIPVVLLARSIGVGVPVSVLSLFRTFTPGAMPILIWGGLRGGISVALALSLPESPFRDTILAATYAVVVFSIIVQGLTIGPLARRLLPKARGDGGRHG